MDSVYTTATNVIIVTGNFTKSFTTQDFPSFSCYSARGCLVMTDSRPCNNDSLNDDVSHVYRIMEKLLAFHAIKGS